MPKSPTPSFPNEPTSPSVRTAVPGPKSLELGKQMDKLQVTKRATKINKKHCEL